MNVKSDKTRQIRHGKFELSATLNQARRKSLSESMFNLNNNIMAKSENNEVMYGARGKVGNLVVFKNFGENQTVISKRRKKIVNPRYTVNQERTKDKFREGVVYAKGIIADPDLTAIYKRAARPGISVYNLALADFCKSPEIKTIDYTSYLGNVGDTISVRAIDNFRVTAVKVSIFSAAGALLEAGSAVITLNSVDWRYTCTIANPLPNGSVIRCEASDFPGNLTTKEVAVL